jgi:hypothetical protein
MMVVLMGERRAVLTAEYLVESMVARTASRKAGQWGVTRAVLRADSTAARRGGQMVDH